MNDRPERAPAPERNRAEIELSQLDLRYEGHRLRQRGLEDRLLASIAREGIREPLAGAVVESVCVLLDGCKRYRCARQLHVQRVPFVTLGVDEASAIVELLSQARRSTLSVLEEARFLDELKARGLSLAEMAEALGRSKAWVSLRLGLLEQMSPVVRQHVFGGGLPAYSWIYTLGPFRRLNGVTAQQVDEFVGAVSSQGLSVRQIARRMGVSRNTVREVVAQQGEPPQRAPVDPPVDSELLRQLYEQCQGRAQRVYEKLREEHGCPLPYSSLTRWLRQLGISHQPPPRCARVPDEPGAEMQHDTSPYIVALAGQPVKLIASLIYLRYSKRRYLRFYRSFNRFKMKCFFHQALMHWGYCAPLCIIDNTNLARLRGLGANAVMTPEMEAFARQHGFVFRCHAPRHSDRKENVSYYTS